MSRQIAELETLVQMLINEHEKLLAYLDAQRTAMKRLDARAMDEAANSAEATRLRIASLDTRRRTLATQLGLAMKVPGVPTLAQIGKAFPAAQVRLLPLGEKLKDLVRRVQSHAQVSGKLAGSVLGHLNTVVRLLAGAVEQAGLYTKHGVPKVSNRIGMLEAVG